jgi:NADH dehydrogenase
VAAIDVDNRRVRLVSDPLASATEPNELAYDHLVLALGSVSNYLGMKGVEENSFDFKTLLDAMRIRNHVIDMFERADRESDPETRRTMVTFVIAGGGFAGVELAGGLNDCARGMLIYYPHIPLKRYRLSWFTHGILSCRS